MTSNSLNHPTCKTCNHFFAIPGIPYCKAHGGKMQADRMELTEKIQAFEVQYNTFFDRTDHHFFEGVPVEEVVDASQEDIDAILAEII